MIVKPSNGEFGAAEKSQEISGFPSAVLHDPLILSYSEPLTDQWVFQMNRRICSPTRYGDFGGGVKPHSFRGRG